jgi:peptidoglycan/LPS O-acetylase OafA/YrhL
VGELKYYHNLDGVRGIAALMVVVFHFFTYPISSYADKLGLYQRITEFGQHEVSLFFILKWFVITRILLDTRGNTDYFGSFYKRGVLLILPLFYLVLLA